MLDPVDEIEDISDPEYCKRHQHEFGRRLLTTLIDDRAQRNHPRPFASIPVSADRGDGYRDVSYRLFANAIDRCAWWMKQQLSISDKSEPLIYVGAFDLRYQILAMAAVKTGYVMFFISPRNSLETQISLIDGAGATKMLVSSGPAIQSMMKPVLEQRPLQIVSVPELEELLAASDDLNPFPFEGTFDDFRMKPWVLLHTSGSTSSSKIVAVRHGYATSFDAYWMSPNGSDLFATFAQRRMFVPFPPFHMAGIVVNTACSVFLDATIVLPPAEVPLTAKVVHEICINARVDIANLPPFILMDMVKNPVYLASLRGLKDLAYGGGPLPQETGDELNNFIRITSFFGSTEACIVPSLTRPREHWKYFKFDNELAGIDFRPVEKTNSLYELVFVRDPKMYLVQAIFVTFPDTDEYRSKDLFSKHPTEPKLWRYEGRLDDMLVLSNAEKMNPVAMEGTITSCSIVKGALVVGTGRFQTAVFIEVDDPPHQDDVTGKEKLLGTVWPYVDMANQQCPTYGRIARELIGFTTPDKPFIRAGKGTIQRTPSVELYLKEIDRLYTHADEVHHHSVNSVSQSLAGIEETQNFLRRWISQETRAGEIQLEQDFFNGGMDSLDVANLTRQLNLTGKDATAKQVYSSPTIKQLAIALNDVQHEQHDETHEHKQQVIKMEQMFNVLKVNHPDKTEHARNGTIESAPSSYHVVLIGSTGSLGTYILHELLLDPKVAQVTCLNRSTDAQSRQEDKHSSLGLITCFTVTEYANVKFLTADLSEPNLGLDQAAYEEIRQTATHVIHNAWTVDFNRHVSSFEPLLQGVKNVIDFTYACMPRGVRLFFMSSVSVADKVRAEQQEFLVPESPLDDWSLASMGYGQSKLIAEALIADAVDRYGIDAAICRLCQLGGPVKRRGVWNPAEWIPSLIMSSKTMGAMPKSLGSMDMVDWLPIDVVAKICLELLFHDVANSSDGAREHMQDGALSHDDIRPDENRLQVWHVVNPNPTLWSQLVPAMVPQMRNAIEVIDFVQWVELLERGGDTSLTETEWDPAKVPSVKLVPLFRHLKEETLKHPSALPVAVFNTKNTVACSETLAQIPAVNAAWIELWMKQWEVPASRRKGKPGGASCRCEPSPTSCG